MTCSLGNGSLKQDYPNISLAKSLTVYNWRNTLAMNVIFFFKMFKIWRRLKELREKLRKCFYLFRWLHFIKHLHIPNITKRILVISSQCFNKDFSEFKYQSEKVSPSQFCSEWQRNLIKLLSWAFRKCFGPFSMLTIEVCFDTVLFKHLRNGAFHSG